MRKIITVDLRAHGLSPRFTEPHTVFNCSHDLLTTLDSIRIQPDVVIGHSFGGKVALGMIMEREELYKKNKIDTWILDVF